jgi:DNA polymerase III subunit gamma/tau
MSYEPLHHKYRPQTFADLVGQETIALTLTNALQQERIAPAYLFTGPRGTGKTSSARILAKSLNCLESSKPTPSPCGRCEVCRAIAQGTALDVLEIDAASNTGVDNIREIIERSRFAPVQCRYKVYAIDECHMLSTAAFNALLKTLEEPPPSVVFILATTDPQRVLSTIISRCQRFDYRRIPLEAMVSHLKYIAREEKIAIADEATTLIAQIANGGLRDAESLLDQLSLLPETISVEKVWDLVGAVPERDLLELLKVIRSDRHLEILQQCRSLLDRGREPLVVLQNLASFYLNLLIAKAAPQRPDLVAVTQTCWQQLCAEATNWDMQLILRGQQHLKEAETQLKHTTQPRLWLEVTLLGLLPGVNSISPVVPSETVTNQPLQLPEETAKRSPSSQNNSVPVFAPPIESQAHQEPIEVRRSPLGQTNSAPPVESPVHQEPIVAQSSKVETTNQPSPALNNLANEEIWRKVVGCLQPLTQALLRQHCHLISLEEGSAIVGISSKELRGLHQGKVSNIEIAFEKVCQRKVKVQLEVETPNQRAGKNPVFPSNNPAPTTFPAQITATSTTELPSEAEDIVPQGDNIPLSHKGITWYKQSLNQAQGSSPIPEVQPEIKSLGRSNININESQVAQTRMVTASATQVQEEPKPRVFTATTVSEVSVLPPPLKTEFTEFNVPTSSESVSTRDLEQDYTTNYLQQAIDNLTQSFEGELVQLDNTANKFMDFSANSETLETKTNSSLAKESLDTETTIKSFNQISSEIKDQNRPNLEEYDDEW